MKKTMLRIISFLLVFVLLVQTSGFLEIHASATNTSVINESTPALVSEPEIIGEDISKREESAKHYKMSDGSWLAASYPGPVHYQAENGAWLEIDNTLVPKTTEFCVSAAAMQSSEAVTESSMMQTEEDFTIKNPVEITETAYGNVANSFGVSLPSSLNEQSWVGAFHDGHSLLFRFENIENANARIVIPDDLELEHSEKMNDTFAANTYSSVAYDNILPGVNVIYELIGQELKESILFDRFSNVPDTLSFVIWADGLTVEENEDGSFVFTANDQPHFFIPAPFMMDSDGESSGKVHVAVEEIDTYAYRFTYTPDQEWLQSPERVWPVILDPVTCAEASRQTILDTYTRQGYPMNNYLFAYRLYTGYLSSATKNTRTFIRHTVSPTLSSGDVVVGAQYIAYGMIYDGYGEMRVTAHAVIEPWERETTWSNQPKAEEEILDFQIITPTMLKPYSWDITSAAQRWYSGDLAGKGELANNGIMLMAPDDEDSGVVHTTQFHAVDGTGYWPQLFINYRNTTGIESYWDYTSANAGRAGTVSVNDYTGNLVVSRTDMAYTGNRLPVSIDFTYNANDADINIGYGNGWRSNYAQTLQSQTIKDKNYYCWTDGDGTRIYFYAENEVSQDENEVYQDENGLGYTLDKNDSGCTITDKDNNQLTFDSNGRLTTVIDGKISNNKILIEYLQGVTDPKISTVTDGANRKYAFAYGSDGNLSHIDYLGSKTSSLETVRYSYSNNNLTTVTYVDGNTATYAYTNGYLSGASGCQNDHVLVNYGIGGSAKVQSITAKDGSAIVNSASFIYGDNYTKVTDETDETDETNKRWCIYQFNNLGNTVSIYNDQGQALYGTYSEAVPNHLVQSSRLQDTVTNLLSDRTFTNSSSLNVSVTEGKAYTLSGTGTGKLTITAGTVTAESPAVTNERTEVTVTVPSGVNQVTISGPNGFHDLQFEQTEAASRYNMLKQTDMTTTSEWTGTNISPEDGQCAEADSRAHLDTYALQIHGNGKLAKQYTQTVTVSGSNGDNYSFGAWVKAASVPLNNTNSQEPDTDPQRRFGIQVRLLNDDSVVAEKYIAANDACAEWQFISGSVQADDAYTNVEFSLIYDYNANVAYFDGAQLFKEKFSYVYEYDEKNRIETVTDLDGNVTSYTYRGDSTDITSIKLPGDATYTYEYDENNNNLLKKTTSATGVQTEYAYDSFGNNNETKISQTGNSAVIRNNQCYTCDGNFLKKVTGEDRNTVTYKYNTNLSTLSKVTDARGTTTTNLYDSMRRLIHTSTDAAAAAYAYDKDRLSVITHSGGTYSTSYFFTYTTAGLTDTVKVGNEYTLVDNTYNGHTLTLASQTYGNGDAWHYTYNAFDDLVSAYTTGGSSGTELKYFYNSEGALARIEQYDTTLSGETITSRALVTTERYYYDTADRMIRISRIDADGDTYACSWEYDHNNNVTELVEAVNGTPTTTAYTYDADQRISSISSGETTTTYNYDGYGRIETQVTKNGDTTVLKDTYNYRYWTSENEQYTSTQVSSLNVEYGGSNIEYRYVYDANGNIVSIDDGTNITAYAYDIMNQLIRENNQAAGKTWVWTYDTGGNITSRTEYHYTAGDLGEPISTDYYTYDDASWGDLLTIYNGTAITHDGIGNPLNDGTWTYSWSGRQLESMTGNGTTWNYKYDSDGLRTERSNGSTTYGYVYSGDSLIHMSVGSNLLYFTYDGTKPTTVTYNGTKYYYVTNLQGDVVAILDGSGNPVVQYVYDTWGKPLSTTGTLADTLGQHNPLRYRGYIYDPETGLYYVSSRYYDPEIGRWINADAVDLLGANGDFTSLNLFTYCGNNPVTRKDAGGYAWETAFDIISLGTSIIEVSCNPADVGAWVGLVGDIIDVAVPFVAGVGETVRAVNAGRKIADAADDMNDARRVASKIHGNSLSSNKINYGYQLIDKNNNIVKYGESKNPLTRYSQKWLDENGYKVQIKVAGTKRGVHEWQHDMIENYAIISGGRPKLNRSMW